MMLGIAPVTSQRVADCATSLAAVLAMDVVTTDVVAAEVVGTSAVKTLLIRWTVGARKVSLISCDNAARITDVVHIGQRSFRGQSLRQAIEEPSEPDKAASLHSTECGTGNENISTDHILLFFCT